MFVVGFAYGLTLVWGAVWVALGIALALTVIGIPLSVLCFSVAAVPFYKITRYRQAQVDAWNNRSRVLPDEEEMEVPWDVE